MRLATRCRPLSQHHFVAGTAGREFGERMPPFVGQDDMTRLAGF